MPLSPGQTFARYTIEGAIGAGGMGEVYAAFDTNLRRRVALKILHPDLAVPDAAARLVREARAAAALTHPNTIAVHDLGQVDGVVFLVMELVSGAPLRAYVGDRTLPSTRKLRWLVDVAGGLAAAHEAGLVHRDVKPTNIMVTDGGVVKVLDFGLAKPVEAASFHTDVGLVVGTPAYMAPELFAGLPADARSDQYAFGVTAYELVSGVHPGGPAGAVPAALDSLVPEVGPAVARVVARTLARDRADRFPSMAEVASALEDAIATAIPAAPSAETALARAPRPPGPPAAVRPEAHAAALAPTELSPSTGAGVTRAPSGPRASIAGLLGVLGLLTFVGVYGATLLVDASARPGDAARAPAAPDVAAQAALIEDAAVETASAAAIGAAADDDAATEATGDRLADAGSADGDDGGGGAEAPLPRPGIVVDDFDDPWLRSRGEAR